MKQEALEQLNQRLTVVRHRGSDADARCPAHDDRSASLTFGPGDNGGVVIKCHAGCQTKDILARVGMTFADISPEPHIVAEYEYRNEAGELLWVTERWEPKTFRQRGLPAKGQRVLYHSEWLPMARERGDTIYVVEGEKDADTLARHGHVAVCGVNGADSWLDHYAEQLRDLDVVVIADNDDPGKDHARKVVKSLDGKALSIALVLPSWGKDITDQLDAGYSLDTLQPLSAHATLGVLRADHVRERAVSWLWPGYLPRGKLVMVDGDPGDGKSVMTCDLAARFSTGNLLPDGQKATSGPIDVVMISAEDDPEDTIKPRLRVAGADQSRIHLVVAGTIPQLPFSLTRDMPALEEFVSEVSAGLVVIDPLMAFMPADIDAYRDSDVRRALHPLTDMAMRSGCTILVVRHMTKGRTKAITAGGGSMGFIGASRVGYLVGPHPDDDRKRVLAGVKINIGPMPKPLGYQIVSSDPGDDYAPPKVVWDSAPLAFTAQEILDQPGTEEDREVRAEAKDWLHEYLCQHHTGMTWPEVVRAGKKDGYTDSTLRRVRKAVAHPERNPQGRDGIVRQGTYWVINKVDRHLQVVPDPEPEPEPGEWDEGEELLYEPLTPPPGTACGLCGQEPAVWFESEGVRRCHAHNPMLYGG